MGSFKNYLTLVQKILSFNIPAIDYVQKRLTAIQAPATTVVGILNIYWTNKSYALFIIKLEKKI